MVAVAVVVIAAAITAGAIAYFSSKGGGTANVTAASPAPLTIEPGTPTGALSPGSSADVAVQVDNPNPFRVRVGSLVLDTSDGNGFSVDSTHSSAGCTAGNADLSFTSQHVDDFVPPKTGSDDGTLTVDLAGAVAMGAAAADACQGATFHVFLQVAAS